MRYRTEILQDPEILHSISKTNFRETLTKNPSLPFPFIPASKDFFKEQFYWDSFFIMQGLATGDENDKEIIKGMIENFFTMIDKYGYIPNSHISYNTRSQPPFLTSMVLLRYRLEPNKKWLSKAYKKIIKEYSYWNKKPKKTSIGLSRYYDNKDHLDKKWDISYGSIQESGWDNTLRFSGIVSKNGKYIEKSLAHQVCAVDLNSLLYKYEKDMQKISKILGKYKQIEKWKNRAKTRKKLINKYCWDNKTGLFYDYDYINKKKLKFKTLASFFPLWTKNASLRQAKLLRKNLKYFEYEHGLTATEESLEHCHAQWSYPNGWAPLHWIVIQGLRNYGFKTDANRITYKWLKICAKNFIEKNRWEEKICVVEHKRRKDDARYKDQKLTNWTEGVFLSLYSLMKN